MKVVQFNAFGQPDKVCSCIEVPDLGTPNSDEIIIEIYAAAINPADLLMIENLYPAPHPPAKLGIEGAGRVVSIGSDVNTLAVGDNVISLDRSNWAQRIRIPAKRAIKIPKQLPFHNAAMLKANPPSAHLMLTDYVDLKEGDWVIQNAANSAVGRHIIRLVKASGVKTINVVRRKPLIKELRDIGADLVILDGPNLAKRVGQKIGSRANVPLAIDAVAGSACRRLADCLSDGGTVVNYGMLSSNPCEITPEQTIVRGISLTGFWLFNFMQRSTNEEISAMYTGLAHKFLDGTLMTPVEASYPIEEIKQALAHSYRESRNGKILLLPNGPL